MHYTLHLLWALTAGSAIVSASPHAIEKRALEVETRVMDGHTVLNVPMSYIGYMSAETGAWIRYACDAETCQKQTGTLANKEDRQMGTNRLATCIDINLISKKGAIKAHVPAHICPLLPGHEAQPSNPRPDADSEKILKNFRDALRQLTTQRRELGEFTVEAVLGPNSRPRNVPEILNHLFQAPSDFGPSHRISTIEVSEDGIATVRLQLIPPALFANGKQHAIEPPPSP
ncbi:MAG: hypothetical protein M1821_009150 [Bathelium mastoideum]|nr:MAG: hypothetical protein M1821_009150 [Bathelium mastoideum]KAI9689531.1 MAG: hypothetical protein M1822_010182 [Bathelium mastoideum]